ncbi:MAG: class I SAM-dependent methyltransferase [Candidatus Hydrogenedentes bacterium]|nr:class I SAM-dependent methyltransferase [Candidatus Hydrogenedentota bacterium]
MDRFQMALDLLRAGGPVLDGAAAERLREHVRLVQEWNRVVSLVSASDLPHILERHTVDSLSLVPVLLHAGVGEGLLLDVGSGGGFPAIPLLIALPGLRAVLVERSDRKAGFLRKAVAALGLTRAEVRSGEFPVVAKEVRADAITARAIERPEKVLPILGEWVKGGAVLLCQAGDPRNVAPKMFHVEHPAPMVHVEHFEDAWTQAGLRRGTLHIVRANATPSTPSESRPE